MAIFDVVIVVDWSASAKPSAKRPRKDAIWIAEAEAEGDRHWYVRTRHAAMALLVQRIRAALQAGKRLLIGFDFPFGYPAGFAEVVTRQPSAFAVWKMLAEMIEDGENNASNRFEIASNLNQMFPGVGPFWGCPPSQKFPDLPHKGRARQGHGIVEKRCVETLVSSAQSCWKLFTTGSVGSQTLLGITRLETLRKQFPDTIAVWPFESLDKPIVLAEIYPSLLDPWVKRVNGVIKDAVQVRLLASALLDLDHAGRMDSALSQASGDSLAEEGWILGVGCEIALREAAENVFAHIDFDRPPLDAVIG